MNAINREQDEKSFLIQGRHNDVYGSSSSSSITSISAASQPIVRLLKKDGTDEVEIQVSRLPERSRGIVVFFII
jgi:hypothetical protein